MKKAKWVNVSLSALAVVATMNLNQVAGDKDLASKEVKELINKIDKSVYPDLAGAEQPCKGKRRG